MMDAGRLIAGASAVPLPSGLDTATVGVLRRPLSSVGGEAAGVRVVLLVEAGDDDEVEVGGARRLDSLRGDSADVGPAMLQRFDAWTDAAVGRVKLSCSARDRRALLSGLRRACWALPGMPGPRSSSETSTRRAASSVVCLVSEAMASTMHGC